MVNYTEAMQAVRMLVALPAECPGEERECFVEQLRMLDEWEEKLAGAHVRDGVAPEVARHMASLFLSRAVAACRGGSSTVD